MNRKHIPKNTNPAKYLTTRQQKKSVNSITDIYDGLFYTMDYTADYKLDKVLNEGISNIEYMKKFLQCQLLNSDLDINGTVDAGCSAFCVKDPTDHIIYGRNFDYKMDMTAVLIRTNPKNGYKSIGMVDAGWIGYRIGSLSNKVTDISTSTFFPYLVMDGMNEKGLVISTLKVREKGTSINTGKTKIITPIAIRLVLDRAANVSEAIKLLESYDMNSSMKDADFHFLISDASGRTVVIEYCNDTMSILNNTYVTNFYLLPEMQGKCRGMDRYEIIKSTLSFKNSILTKSEAMSLLELISQPETEESTSMTQWSIVYDLNDLNATVSIRRNYKKLFYFEIK